MTPPKLVLCLTYLILGNIVRLTNQNFSASHQQERRFVSVNVGQSVTLHCFYDANDATRFYWYKQNLGQKPKLISTHYVFKENGTFHGEFENNPRFTLEAQTGENHLYITDLQNSDSGSYFCARRVSLILEFSEGTTVSVKDSGLSIKTLVHQSDSETIEPGDTVTLNCTVHTGTCEGEHSVYWFKDSGGSHPGLIYTHGGRNDQCERKPNEQTHSCTYTLLMKSPGVSHAGTYYCAVASCGHILLGNGTTLEFKDDVGVSFSPVWSSAFAFSSVLSLLLAFSVCMMSKKCVCNSPESQASPPKADAKGFQEAGKHFVATSSFNPRSRSETQRDHTWSQCVYYSIKL